MLRVFTLLALSVLLVGCQPDNTPVEPTGQPLNTTPTNGTPGVGNTAPNGSNNNSMENNAVDRTNPDRPNASGNGSGPVNTPGTVAPNQGGAGTSPGAHTGSGK